MKTDSELTERSARMAQIKFVCSEIDQLQVDLEKLQANAHMIVKKIRFSDDYVAVGMKDSLSDARVIAASMRRRLEKMHKNLVSICMEDYFELVK